MKVIGIGLNKTGTKTLKYCLKQWGFHHQSYDLNAFQLFREKRIDELLKWMEKFDSFEDWPWPLFYREIDGHFPDAKFVVTKRTTPEQWYRSLCKMAVRMGPLNDFEKHIYGFSMPQGHKREHLEFYEQHNREVDDYFADRPGKLLKICWENDNEYIRLAEFIGREQLDQQSPHRNVSLPVYSGDNLIRAQFSRVLFQTKWKVRKFFKTKLKRRLKNAVITKDSA